MYQNILTQLGLTDNQAKTYTALLKLGPSPILPILKAVKLKRSNTYAVLNSLAKKGLVLIRKKNKKTIFEPQPPEKLQNLLRERYEAIEKTKKDLQELLPSLKSQYLTSTEKPMVRFLGGIEGIKEVYQDILRDKKDLLIFASVFDRELPELDRIIKRQIKAQARLNIKVRALSWGMVSPERDRRYIANTKKWGIENRLIRDWKLPSQIIIYGNKVALTSLKKDLITMLVEHEDIAKTFRKVFEFIWEASSRENAKYFAELFPRSSTKAAS